MRAYYRGKKKKEKELLLAVIGVLNIAGLIISTSYINLLLHKASSSSYAYFYAYICCGGSLVIRFSAYATASPLGASSSVKTSSILRLLLFI